MLMCSKTTVQLMATLSLYTQTLHNTKTILFVYLHKGSSVYISPSAEPIHVETIAVHDVWSMVSYYHSEHLPVALQFVRRVHVLCCGDCHIKFGPNEKWS